MWVCRVRSCREQLVHADITGALSWRTVEPEAGSGCLVENYVFENRGPATPKRLAKVLAIFVNSCSARLTQVLIIVNQAMPKSGPVLFALRGSVADLDKISWE